MFWETFHIKANKIYYARIGPLEIWLKRYLGDWYIAAKRESKKQGFEKPKACNISNQEYDWARWVIDTKTERINLRPVMPDRPFVIRPLIPIKILADNEGIFYINIPIWVRIEIAEKEPITICELPIQILSNSWFGDTFNGEICYSKKSMVRKDITELEDNPCGAICSVRIKNKSKSELTFERFCLNVENLTLFSDSERLCTNQVNIVFQGEDQVSQITIAKSYANIFTNCKKISQAREEIGKNIIKKGFQFFKTLTGF